MFSHAHPSPSADSLLTRSRMCNCSRCATAASLVVGLTILLLMLALLYWKFFAIPDHPEYLVPPPPPRQDDDYGGDEADA